MTRSRPNIRWAWQFATVLWVLGGNMMPLAAAPDVSQRASKRPAPPIVRGMDVLPTDDPAQYAEIARWEANCVRLIVLGEGVKRVSRQMKEDFWDAWPSIVDGVVKNVKMARAAGLKVVVDLHNPPVPHLTDRNRSALWENPGLTADFCRAWKDLA